MDNMKPMQIKRGKKKKVMLRVVEERKVSDAA